MQLNFVPNKAILLWFHFFYRNMLLSFSFSVWSPHVWLKPSKQKSQSPKRQDFTFIFTNVTQKNKIQYCYSFILFLHASYSCLHEKLKESLTNFKPGITNKEIWLGNRIRKLNYQTMTNVRGICRTPIVWTPTFIRELRFLQYHRRGVQDFLV